MFLPKPLITTLVFAIATVVGKADAVDRWKEAVFTTNPDLGRLFVVVNDRNPAKAHQVVGKTSFYKIEDGDTLLDVGRFHGLGNNEMMEANPGVERFVPPPGQMILLPKQWVLPDTDYSGIKINIPEMRLYFFQGGIEGITLVSTFPVGLGRTDWRTPLGKFRIRGKTENPTWVLPESIKAEHRKEGKPAPDFILGGDPEESIG